jgi:hypothetical protein
VLQDFQVYSRKHINENAIDGYAWSMLGNEEEKQDLGGETPKKGPFGRHA